MYAGESYGSGNAYSGESTVNPVKLSGLTTERATAVIVIGALLALVALRRGFLPTNVGRLTGGLVK